MREKERERERKREGKGEREREKGRERERGINSKTENIEKESANKLILMGMCNFTNFKA